MQMIVTLGVWTALVYTAVIALRTYLARSQVMQRLSAPTPDTGVNDDNNPFDQAILVRWLSLAGIRDRNAATVFVVATATLLGVGIVLAYAVTRSGLLQIAMRSAEAMPGGIGSLTRPVWPIAPWMFAAILTLLPTLYVRRARRQRVQLVEQDLPITLELLATLGESGIAIDAALARILDGQRHWSPLVSELRQLQAELLAGRSRIECLRRLAHRLDVTTVTVFISAIVQAEQIGLGVATVLRQQADDLRMRRRERALEFSMSLPVKQMFPLVICFLPGILVFAVGPLFAEFLRYTSTYSTFRNF